MQDRLQTHILFSSVPSRCGARTEPGRRRQVPEDRWRSPLVVAQCASCRRGPRKLLEAYNSIHHLEASEAKSICGSSVKKCSVSSGKHMTLVCPGVSTCRTRLWSSSFRPSPGCCSLRASSATCGSRGNSWLAACIPGFTPPPTCHAARAKSEIRSNEPYVIVFVCRLEAVTIQNSYAGLR